MLPGMKPLACIIFILPLLLAPACIADSWIEEPWKNESLSTQDSNMSLPDLMPLNIAGNESQIASLNETPYANYTASARSYELWIRNNSTWARYIQVHQGDSIDLIAYTSRPGHADLYRISYSRGAVYHRGYDLLAGYYNTMMSADEVGRTFLILVLDNQPSAVIIDALPAEKALPSGPVDVKSSIPGKAKVTIKSERVNGYDVYVDGVFYSSDIADGALDGIDSFTLDGDRTYTITVSKRDVMGTTYKSEYRRSFKGGYAYTLKI